MYIKVAIEIYWLLNFLFFFVIDLATKIYCSLNVFIFCHRFTYWRLKNKWHYIMTFATEFATNFFKILITFLMLAIEKGVTKFFCFVTD